MEHTDFEVFMRQLKGVELYDLMDFYLETRTGKAGLIDQLPIVVIEDIYALSEGLEEFILDNLEK